MNLELLPALLEFAQVCEKDYLVDAGCGDGRVLIEAARKSGCRALGIERQASLCKLATDHAAQAGVGDRVKIITSDDYLAHLAEATVLFSFVPMSALGAEFQRLRRHLSRHARIVAHEQVRLPADLPAPSHSAALLGQANVTVAHCWQVADLV